MLLLLLLLLFDSGFELVYNLQCAHNCSMVYTIDQAFTLPSNCTYIAGSRCSVKLVLWYDRGNYVVTFPGDTLSEQNIGDNEHFLMIETATKSFFSYDINHVCKDQEDCARRYVEMKIPEMRQRSFSISSIYAELRRILYQRPEASPDLACFDTNDAVRQCAVSGMIGTCQIVDDLVKYKLHRRSCQRTHQLSASVNIYDSDSFAMMTVKCNRMLCNGPLTIEAVKKVLFRHNITNAHGRLPGKGANVSLRVYLFLLALFLSFQLK